jgi:hypothetical protein
MDMYTLQRPVLLLKVSTQQGPKLHLDVSTLQRPVLLLEVSSPQVSELHLDLSTLSETGAALGGVYTTGACLIYRDQC